MDGIRITDLKKMIKETTGIDKCAGVLFAMAISSVCFAFAAVEGDTLKSLYLLFFAVLAVTILPIVFLWPRSERVSEHSLFMM